MARRSLSDGRTRFGTKDTAFLRTARERFRLADSATSDQRKREQDDLAFYAGDQWPTDVKLTRQGQQPVNGMPAVPARPTLVINNVREPIRQIANEARASELGITITPADDFGDLGVTPDEAEIALREGLVRKIQRESKARDARMWAYDRAVKSGRGFYQVLTRYLPGKTFDQEVYVDRIYNQAQVLLDPSHKEPDGSDAKWAFVWVDVLWDDYRAQYPNAAGKKNPLVANIISDSDWSALGEEYPNWFREISDAERTGTDRDGEKKVRAARVVDYWHTEYEIRTLCILQDATLVYEDELPEDFNDDLIVDRREVTAQTIRCTKIDGAQILEETDWPGPDLPIIKVMGEELQPFDNQQRAEGMVRPSRDSQMGLNYMISKQVEMVGLTPLTPLMVDPEAIEDFPEYSVLNTRVVPFARYRTYDDQGRPLKEPHRPNADPNLLPISQSIALFGAQIEKTTAVPAARLGDIDPVTRSGKALDRLTANSQKSTSNFLDNLVRSLRYEGQVVNNLLYPIYGARPGRIVRVLTNTGESQTMLVGDPQQQARLALGQKISAVAKLTPEATFNCAVKVTREFETRRQEENALLGELIASAPEAMLSTFGDLWFETMDAPGHREMAERARVMLNPRIQAYLAAKQKTGVAPSPVEMQLQAENIALKQQLQQAGMLIQTKQIEQKGKFVTTQMQEHHEDERAALDREKDITIAEINALAKELQDTRAFFMEERARIGSQQHDQTMQSRDLAHQAMQSVADRQQATEQMAADAAMQHTQAAAQAAQPPTPNGAGA